MSGNAISYGEGPIQQLYDSCGPDGGEGPYALCGFVFGNGAREPPADDVLRPQVRTSSEKTLVLLLELFAPFDTVEHVGHCRFMCAAVW